MSSVQFMIHEAQVSKPEPIGIGFYRFHSAGWDLENASCSSCWKTLHINLSLRMCSGDEDIKKTTLLKELHTVNQTFLKLETLSLLSKQAT